MGSLRQKVVKGMVWVTLEKLSRQALHFVVAMILARLLCPNDFGLVAMLSVFDMVAEVLAEAGLGRALVQKKDADDVDFNTMFYASVVLTTVVYSVLFAIAPMVADWYGIPKLKGLLRLMALTIVFNGVSGVQQAELSRNLLFHLGFRINLTASIGSAVIGVILAWRGFGAWALAWSMVASSALHMVMRWVVIAWRPKLMFSWRALRSLWWFGWRATAVSLIDRIYGQVSSLLIGKIYTPADLAYVERGGSLSGVVMNVVNQSITRVTYPALAKVQDDTIRIREAMRRMIRTSSFLIFPAMVGCAACSSELIPILFGDQWLPAVPFVWLACFSSALMPFHTINLNCIAACGRMDIFLRLEVLKKALGVLLIVLFIKEGVFVFVLIRTLVMGPISLIINTWPNRRLLKYPIWSQVKDIAPIFVASALMGAAVWGCGWVNLPCGVKLAVQILVGVALYAALAWGMRIEAFNEYRGLLQRVIKRRS